MHASSRHPAHYKRTLFAELLLITEIQVIIFLARLATDAHTVLLLDGGLMLSGIFVTAFVLVRHARIWFLLCGVLPIVAGTIQILLSFGVEWVLLASLSVLLLADMVANLILLVISFLKGPCGSRARWPG